MSVSVWECVCLRVRVCVCVCERKRGEFVCVRERERTRLNTVQITRNHLLFGAALVLFHPIVAPCE